MNYPLNAVREFCFLWRCSCAVSFYWTLSWKDTRVTTSPSEPNTAHMRKFVRWLLADAPDDVFFELTAIAPLHLDLKPRVMTQSYDVRGGMPVGVQWRNVAAVNADGYGVYYALTLKRNAVPDMHARSKENDTAVISVLWADFDGGDFPGGKIGSRDADGHLHDDGALDGLLSVWPPAHAVIDSGGGYHGLWPISPIEATPENMRRVKAILRGIAKRHSADPHAVDLARVFRLPGTVNTKEGRGQVCKLLSTMHIQPHYTLDDFAEYERAGSERQRPSPPPHRFTPTSTPSREASELPHITQYLGTTHQPGTRNSALFGAAFYLHSNGYPQGVAQELLVPHAVGEGLDEREVLRTIKSAYDRAPGTPSNVSPRMRTRAAAADNLRNES